MAFSWVVLKRISCYLGWGIVATSAIAGIAALTPRQWGESPRSSHCDFKVYVAGDRLHVNLIVPVETPVFDWRKHLDLSQLGNPPGNQPGSQPSPNYRYLQFGWGERIWYTETPSWEAAKYTDVFRVLFRPGNTAALLVKGHTTVPQDPQETIKCVKLDQANYLALVKFIEASFDTDAQGNKQLIRRGPDGDSSFYAANGNYSILKTCNSWAADGLRAAHVNTPIWGGLAPAVMRLVGNGCPCDP